MIKLKTLLVEQENKYPEDAPEHFGGGERDLINNLSAWSKFF